MRLSPSTPARWNGKTPRISVSPCPRQYSSPVCQVRRRMSHVLKMTVIWDNTCTL